MLLECEALVQLGGAGGVHLEQVGGDGELVLHENGLLSKPDLAVDIDKKLCILGILSKWRVCL